MSLAERVYFTILIPVTLVILIIIMTCYTVTEINISSQLESETAKQEENMNSSVVGYRECSDKLEVTKQGVEQYKVELTSEQRKKKELEEEQKKCQSEKGQYFIR